MKSALFITVTLLIGVSLQSCSNGNNSSDKNKAGTPMSQMAHTDTKDMNEMMQSMHSIMENMDAMKMSGNLDIDFANMMVMHHQAAIDMSEEEIAKGNDSRIKTMAQNIITAQKVEIAQLQQFVKNYRMPETKMEKGEMQHEMKATMKTMMDNMMNMKMTGNTDKDFVMMMIPHHESAVAMAEAEISKGKESTLRKMAQKMVTDQNREIKEFKAWLDNNK
jgi:uncharacterized protein (DUF305 family)